MEGSIDQDQFDELRIAAARCRDREFAEMLVVIMGVAAETHGDSLRAAIGKVYDQSAIEETNQRIVSLVQMTCDKLDKVRDRLCNLERQCERLESRISSIDRWLDMKDQRRGALTGRALNGSAPVGQAQVSQRTNGDAGTAHGRPIVRQQAGTAQ